MNKQEFIQAIEEAQDLIIEAQSIVDGVMNADEYNSMKAHYEAYGKYGFSQLLGNGNPYDNSLQSLIDEYEDDSDYEE